MSEDNISVKLMMDPSTNPFQEGQFSLIHIPLHLYSSLLQPILQVLLPTGIRTNPSNSEGILGGLSSDNKHGFLDISVTPIECSIVCHTSWAQNVFLPVIERLPPASAKEVQISKDLYIVFSVSSAGMEAGQRVIDLTAPLAMANIPIFFITTYYTDFILVPAKDRNAVSTTLLARGFEFSEHDSAYVAPTVSHSREPSAVEPPPHTPPPTNVAELQIRTFAQLRKRNVVPRVEEGLRLVQCSGKEIMPEDDYNSYSSHHKASSSSSHPSSFLRTLDPKLYCGLVAALSSQPRFLSITLALDDAPSLLLDKELLWLFGNCVVGDTEGELVPIFLDLVDLPLESTGIVCGVAGKLVSEMRGDGEGGESDCGSEMGYLSTARAGAVVLGWEGSERAMVVLGGLLGEGSV